METHKRTLLFPSTDALLVAALFDIGQSVVWWYHIAQGIRDPPHAGWLNPIVWLTPASYLILSYFSRGRDERHCEFSVLGPLTLIYLGFTFYNVMARSQFKLSAGSYSISPQFPLTTNTSCEARLASVVYPLYSDPLARHLSKIQAGQFALTFLPIPIMLFRPSYTIFIYAVAACSFIWMLTGVIGTAVLANRGTPIMWDAYCGFVVIAMSPRVGYWDIQVKRSYGYTLQIVKSVSGMCKCLCFGVDLSLITQPVGHTI
jgi:hypothetical protein